MDIRKFDFSAYHLGYANFQSATIQQLHETIIGLNATISSLMEEIRLLKGQKKSHNSSIPPSKDENRPVRKTNSLCKSSGKKPGDQHVHDGSTLLMCSSPDSVEDHAPRFCQCCGLGMDAVEGKLLNRRQVIDIPAALPTYTEHRIFAKRCSCGHTTEGSFPNGVNAPVSYGPNTRAQIAYLHTRQYMFLARIANIFV